MLNLLSPRCVAPAAVAALLSSSLFAADVYVDAAADCFSADGSAAAPYCTIQDGISSAAPGDTVRVRAGTYPDTVRVSKDIRILGLDGAETTIIGGGPYRDQRLQVDPGISATVEGLTVTGPGAGVVNRGALTMRNCVVRDCLSHNILGSGPTAGISNVNATGPLVLVGTRVVDNFTDPYYSGPYAGGLTSSGPQPAVLIDSEFGGNEGPHGGDLRCLGSLRVEGCTIGTNGGATWCFLLGDVTTIVNSTFAGASGFVEINPPGGGIATLQSSTFEVNVRRTPSPTAGTVAVGGTILANEAKSAEGPFLSLGHNLVSQAQFATGFGATDQLGFAPFPLDAGLDVLADNGGPTETLALLPTSPARGAGPSGDSVTVDQRGRLRTPGAVDVGAYQSGDSSLGFSVAGCTGNPNGSGRIAYTLAIGSDQVADNNVTLAALDVTPNQFGIFIVSRTAGFMPLSGGNLCLAGSIGRFLGPGQIQNSGPLGRMSIPLDLDRIPQGASLVSVQPGETWRFQAWFRDTFSEAGLAVATEVSFM